MNLSDCKIVDLGFENWLWIQYYKHNNRWELCATKQVHGNRIIKKWDKKIEKLEKTKFKTKEKLLEELNLLIVNIL